jgi:hypothetical protein
LLVGYDFAVMVMMVVKGKIRLLFSVGLGSFDVALLSGPLSSLHRIIINREQAVRAEKQPWH